MKYTHDYVLFHFQFLC